MTPQKKNSHPKSMCLWSMPGIFWSSTATRGALLLGRRSFPLFSLLPSSYFPSAWWGGWGGSPQRDDTDAAFSDSRLSHDQKKMQCVRSKVDERLSCFHSYSCFFLRGFFLSNRPGHPPTTTLPRISTTNRK